jgi:hypothetical protein
MWATALGIVMLASLLAALGYLAFATRRLDTRLDALLEAQIESRRGLEIHVELVREGPPLSRG